MVIIESIVWLLSRLTVMPLLYAPPLRMRRRGIEHVPATGPVLLVCNHVSVADPIVLMAAARPRRTSMMAKSELFKMRLFGWYLRCLRAFPVRREHGDVAAIRHAIRLLDDGDCVVVFPEGKVSRSGIMRRGHPGAGMFALRPGVTVVPAVTWDTQLFRGPARVVFGPPIDFSDIAPGPRKRRNREATDKIMTVLAGMVAEVGGPVQDPPLGAPDPLPQLATAEVV
jgi:1-acyl-sn-glycerol-3-phosphate acyltransferase